MLAVGTKGPMQALGARAGTGSGQTGASPTSGELPDPENLRKWFRWIDGHQQKPVDKQMSLFELEGLVAKRMEVLARIDQYLNSPTNGGVASTLRWLEAAVRSETVYLWHSALGETKRKVPEHNLDSTIPEIFFSPEDEVISHCVCRFAFCTTDKWRMWFLKVEELLFQARLNQLKQRARRITDVLLASSSIPVIAVPKGHPQILAAADFYNRTKRMEEDPRFSEDDLCLIAFQQVLKLVRRREVVCVNGYAVILKHDISELLISRYKIGLSRNLADALRKRSNFADEEEEESETSNVYSMVDTFLTRFVSDPGDALKETPQGVVLHSDIPTLAKLHMPLCMSRVDRHLRETGHLKHHGRWMLGLFLKSIGLSLDSSIQYWSDLMTLKGGGGPGKTVEAFKKGTYGYGLRHMYGQEGKRTSYSSMSCASILEMPPQMDKHDCHGCPFKFRDEGLLRHLLSGEKINPATMQPVHLAQSDIEDIVKDAKGSHYTRACYKYYVATHPGIPRDNLFRSPYEYYSVSLEVSKAGEKQRGGSAGTAAPAGSSPQAPGNATPIGRQGEVKTEGDPNPPSARRTLQFPADASPPGTK